MEVQTREDIHSLCLFDTIEQIEVFQALIDASLPSIKNQSEHFGAQYVVDQTGEFIREEDQLLIASCSLSLNEAWKTVTEMGGLFIPAHINRKAFGLIESLGFVPLDIPFDALEISRHITPAQALLSIPSIGKTPLIQNGDVHRLDEFTGTLYLQMDNPSISEIRMAFHGINGRFFEIRV